MAKFTEENNNDITVAEYIERIMNEPGDHGTITQYTKGDTLYIVEHIFSKNARETPEEKIKRLILNAKID